VDAVEQKTGGASGFELLAEEFITPEQLAQLLGKKLRTINWWREDKQGPPYTLVGKTVLYKKSSVMRWLTEREVTPRKSRKAGSR